MNYILGANPRNCSYLVSFGSCYPQTPHHREAHGSWTNDITSPTAQRHILYGALVGGPGAASDAFSDNRQNYQTNEPADDYNAGLSGALARLDQEYGGSPVASLPDKAHDDDEIYAMASLNNAGPSFSEIQAHFVNKTGWPARLTSDLSLRYYFTLEPNMLTLSTQYTECGSQLSGPTQYSGNIYFITVSCAGVPLYPGGQSNYQKQVQFRISSAGAWDPTNDWSYQGIAAQGASPLKVSNIQVFAGSTLAWGTAPGGTTTPNPTVSPTPTPLPTPTGTPPPAAACQVHSAITNQWQGGFGASFTLTNSGSTAINGWNLQFSFPNAQTITRIWNGTYTQVGSTVTLSNLSYNASIAPGSTLSSEPGFNGSWSGTNASPTSFTLNSTTCSVV